MKTPVEIINEQMEIINDSLRKITPDGFIQDKGTPVKIRKIESELSHEQKTVRIYAHDYRDMEMSEVHLTDMLEGFAEALQCDHQCSSNCRRNGCNCACGEYHF
jgi:hypothetical protein